MGIYSDTDTCIILAGGHGTRLQEITRDLIPKPMLIVQKKPFLHWLMKDFQRRGFRRFILSVHHLHEQIESYPWEFDVTFVRELQKKGREGAIDYVFDRCRSLRTALVINGDTWILGDLERPTTSEGQIKLWCAFRGDMGVEWRMAPRFQYHPGDYIDIGTPQGLERLQNILPFLIGN